MPSGTWLIRGLTLLAVIASLGLFILIPSPPPAPPQKETDLRRIYALLPERCQFDDLKKWCGLPISEANPQEATVIRQAVESASDRADVWCSPLTTHIRAAPPRSYHVPKGTRWYRLYDPSHPDQWIGIGVCEQHNTGWTAHWIVCRLAVGFAVDG
jgi:hypothetical protein